MIQLQVEIRNLTGSSHTGIHNDDLEVMISFALWSTVSVLTPTDASHSGIVVVARVAIGVAQGFLIPSVHTVLSQVSCT